MKLILPYIAFPSTLKPNWLNVNMNLVELEMDASRITQFQANAFNSSVFTTVKRLTLKDIRLLSNLYNNITKNLFVGLVALEELKITKAVLKVSDNGWLDNISGTIRSLLLTGMGGEPSFVIEKLTGGSSRVLANVTYVKIEYNLLRSIDERSFTAIPNVKELDLSNCEILLIAERSFENFGSKLLSLNLERNRLTTLPVGIFSSLLLSSNATLSTNLQSDEELNETVLTIYLGDNLWDCNCTLELEYLQELLATNTNFAGEILCTTPGMIVNHVIKDTVLCPCPITTEATTESTTTTLPIEEDANDDDNDADEKECLSYNDAEHKTNISIQPQMQRIQLNETSEGVTVILDKYSTDLILIWFKAERLNDDVIEYYRNSNATDCFANLSHAIHVKDLDAATSYTLCVMNITQQSVSPLDCISYYNQGNEKRVWFYASSKWLTISLIVIGCIANIIVGVIIGAIFVKFSNHEKINFRLAITFWKDSKREAINSKLIDNFK